MTAGYSGTPLSKKLGIKEGFTVYAVNSPENYAVLLDPLPPNVNVTEIAARNVALIHIFTNNIAELQQELSKCRHLIKQDGSIWVSWYKKAAKLATEVTEDTIRDTCFPLGLVDIKVCAVDEKWSGLKLVIRKENRI